jgi:hypothetical protein
VEGLIMFGSSESKIHLADLPDQSPPFDRRLWFGKLLMVLVVLCLVFSGVVWWQLLRSLP